MLNVKQILLNAQMCFSILALDKLSRVGLEKAAFTHSEIVHSQDSLPLELKCSLQSHTTCVFSSPRPDGSHQRASPTANSTFQFVDSLHFTAIGLGAFLFPTSLIFLNLLILNAYVSEHFCSCFLHGALTVITLHGDDYKWLIFHPSLS